MKLSMIKLNFIEDNMYLYIIILEAIDDSDIKWRSRPLFEAMW